VTNKAQQFTVTLSISRAEFERLYRGQAKTVLTHDHTGKTLQFPALSLQPFVTHDGVQGTFVISIDANNRLLDIQRKA